MVETSATSQGATQHGVPPLIVALVDDVFFQAPIESAAHAAGFDLEFAQPTEDIVAWLTLRQPSLLLIDLNIRTLDWSRLVLATKTSPATRRIPILAFGSHKDERLLSRARQLGCDAVLSNGAFMADPASHLRRHARLSDPAELFQECQESLPELAAHGIEAFNAGAFYEQHEMLEAAWRAESRPVRQLYQGILQVGVAYYQIQRHNYVGARKMFQRAWQYLVTLPDVCQGVDVAQLRCDARAAQDELERLGPERIADFPASLFRPIRMVEHRSRAPLT
ncbi:MAG: DUF309 domain-containing protein [Anaerolineae bacterium]|nr:DUF309 domain-containing protein [Thermoflexales bacterium]MDW8408709.1 DUF309 domain-containing protein [Anaerolineae bacterium]